MDYPFFGIAKGALFKFLSLIKYELWNLEGEKMDNIWNIVDFLKGRPCLYKKN